MFGYIKPNKPELKVRELEYYRAVYCGLCRSMGNHTGCFSRFTLSYDFVFLCLIRMVLSDVKPAFARHRCMAHPLTKRLMCDDNESLAYSAMAAATLTECKIRDDINDESGARRFAAKFIMLFAKKMRDRAEGKAPVEEIELALNKLSELEGAKCESLDTVANTFGELLSAVMAYGYEGSEARIAKTIGYTIGRYIYVLDAADDLEDDIKNNSYNPLRYFQIEKKDLSVAVRLELKKLEGAVNLLDFSGKRDIEGIIKNIIYLGMPSEADRVFNSDCKAKHKKERKV